MSGVTSFSIELERPSGVYFAGDTVIGRVIFVSTKDIETRGVHISYKCTGHSLHTEGGHSKHSSLTIYNGERVYDEYRCTLLGGYYKQPGPVVETTILQAGTFERAFAFPVRIGAIGSVETAPWEDGRATIRYFLNAFIDLGKKNEPSEGRTDPSVSLYITVLPSRPLPSPELLRAIEYMRNLPTQIPYSCLMPWVSKGDFNLNAKLARQAFAPGEPLDFYLRVNNNSDLVLNLQVDLVCSVLLQSETATRSYPASVHRHTKRVVRNLLRCFIEPCAMSEIGHDSTNSLKAITHGGAGGSSSSCMRKVLAVPSVPPSFCGVSLASGAGVVDPVTITYNIVFSVSTLGVWGDTNSSISFPVVICAAPPSASALQAARAQPARQLYSAEGWGALRYDLNFVPAMAEHERVPVPTVVSLGPVTSTTYQASTGMLSRGVVTATNHASYGITYTAADLAAAAVPSAPAMQVQVQATESRAEAEPMPTVAVTADPVTSLMDSLRSSADLRATVRVWAASTNIRVVHALSPKDLQRVLQSVSISSDQVIVARELAQVFVCTCAHVVAALGVCSCFKADLALAMAPYVQDKENKVFVLGLLPQCDHERVDAVYV